MIRGLVTSGLLTAAALVWALAGNGGPALVALGPELRLGLYTVAILLAWRFQRSRVMSATILLALLDFALDPLAVSGPAPQGFVALAGILSLAYVVLLAYSRDHGLLSPAGLLHAFAPAALMGLLVLARTYEAAGLTALVEWSPAAPGAEGAAGEGLSLLDRAARQGRILADDLMGLVPGRMSPALGVAAGASGLLLLLSFWSRGGPVQRGLFWAAVSVGAALAFGSGSADASLMLLAGGLILGISVVELSYALAYKDDLTGLPSRRALRRKLKELKPPFTLAMVDVDHFKRINDRHGHDVGDQALRLVAARLEAKVGTSKVFRYGGEEFALVIPGRDRMAAESILEGARKGVEESRFRMRGRTRTGNPEKGRSRRGNPRFKKMPPQTLSVTVSIGAADSAKSGEPQRVLKMADRALYKAKERGRNRVVL
jgi:GGDEF domain-containing protein